jgi:hypothetical protein
MPENLEKQLAYNNSLRQTIDTMRKALQDNCGTHSERDIWDNPSAYDCECVIVAEAIDGLIPIVDGDMSGRFRYVQARTQCKIPEHLKQYF